MFNTLNKMTIASNDNGYVLMEPAHNSSVRLVAVSHSGNTSTAPRFMYCRNHGAILAEAAKLLEAIADR